MKIQTPAIIASLAGMLAVVIPALAAAPDVLTLDQSKPFIAPSTELQKLSESINLQKGQEKLRLTLTYTNGSETAPSFSELRISSPSMSYLTEAQFGKSKVATEDVTGQLTWGGNQILITAKGPKGASFGWRLTTPKPKIEAVTPQKAEPGSNISISGDNFCPDTAANIVTINGEQANCLAATANSLTVQLPNDIKSGTADISVKVAGLPAEKSKVLVSTAVPHLTSLNTSWIYPDMNLVITGENFGTDPGAISVQLGSLPCNVVAATDTSITVHIPAAFAGSHWNYYQPVKVEVNGVRSRNILSVGVGDTG